MKIKIRSGTLSLHSSVRTDLSLEADENNIVWVSSISTTHFVPKSISVKVKENEINLRDYNTKS